MINFSPFWQVTTPANIAAVQGAIEASAALDPNAPGVSKRRNGIGLAPTSFQRIIKHLRQHPYKQRTTPSGGDLVNRLERLQFCLQIHQSPDAFFRSLIITDETTLR